MRKKEYIYKNKKSKGRNRYNEKPCEKNIKIVVLI